MISTVFGYAINGNKVDIGALWVALACIPISEAWSNFAVWWLNKKPASGPEKAIFP